MQLTAAANRAPSHHIERSMNRKLSSALCLITLFGTSPLVLHAQATTTQQAFASEDFTGATNTNSWYFFAGACLTAGSTNAVGNPSPGQIPSCTSLRKTPGLYYDSYYQTGIVSHNYFDTRDEPLVGGNSGTLDTLPDTPAVGGALRFTNEPTVAVAVNGNDIGAGYFESGAILSNFTFPLATQGVHIQFTSETYSGDGGGGDGADGISFFLQDASYPPDLGATGGSLSYSCSNINYNPATRPDDGTVRGYDGLVGAYIGVGIDEFGDFNNPRDNTATGPGFGGNRIGVRGAGLVGWRYLSTSTVTQQYYPPTLAYAKSDGSVPAPAVAVRLTCQSGIVWDFSNVTSTTVPDDKNFTSVNGTSYKNPYNAVPVMIGTQYMTVPDYQDIQYVNLPVQIANERGSKLNQQGWFRGYNTSLTNLNPLATTAIQYGVPITYDLTITAGGQMSFAYSYAGGAYVHVLDGRQITTNNGNLPSSVRFGFASSDGAHTNIHELLCFQASPPIASQSSASTNQKQSAPVIQGSQVYFSSYNPNTWAGSVLADSLLVDANGNVYFSALANWDASCVLTGSTSCLSTGVNTPAEKPGDRAILTWNGTAGQPFEWASLSGAQQAALDTGDGSITPSPLRQAYFRGDRTQELDANGNGLFRARASVLGDVVDSSPTWVGPPSHQYSDVWSDNFDSATVAATSIPENQTGAQAYSVFKTQEASRINVVYAGANDGFLHGFRAGYYANGVYVGTGTGANFVGTNNDGDELLAYMPAYVLNQIQTPTPSLDYSSPNYGHQFEVDATPGTDDVFYNNAWHTILVGGLGPGGAAIFALDVTNPADTSQTADAVFSEANAANLVIGEWSTTTTSTASATGPGTTTTTSTLKCLGSANAATSAADCGKNLGNTYGSPVIRRFHNGVWGAVFGNGFGSSTGDAGIYVMLLGPSMTSNGTPAVTFYYLSTGAAGTGTNANGIAYTTPVDLDNDKITDYVYAGDLQGNVWRFDLTSADPTQWTVSGSYGAPSTPTPIFAAGSAQPITTKLIAASLPDGLERRLLIEFGTGRQIPVTNSAPTSYTQSPQYLYGIWDSNFSIWNKTSLIQYAFQANQNQAALSGLTNLQVQNYSLVTLGAGGASAGTDYRAVSTNTICWAGESCSANGNTTTGTQFGWYMALAYGNANSADVNVPLTSTGTTVSPSANLVYEQVIYNPILTGNVFLVNTTIPATVSLTNCSTTVAGGWTIALDPATGGAFKSSFFAPNGVFTDANGLLNGLAQNGTGSVFLVTTGTGANTQTFLGSQASNGQLTNGTGNGAGGTGGAVPKGACAVGVNGLCLVGPPKNQTGARLTWIQKR
jgi:type IV pilus assembly protein PilY1